jgi:hypothetical protein
MRYSRRGYSRSRRRRPIVRRRRALSRRIGFRM